MPDPIQPPVQPATHDEIVAAVQAILATLRTLQGRCHGAAYLPWQVALKRVGDNVQGLVDRANDYRPRG